MRDLEGALRRLRRRQMVLDSDAMPKLGKGFFVVASICESRADAQAKLDRIKGCRPEIAGAIRQVR